MAVRIYSTCPQSKDVPRDVYLRRVADVSRWSEDAGCAGMLVYTDNGIVDPWLVAQVAIQHTERLRPLVAVQPVYSHPYTVAKQVTSLAYLHDRSVDLNMLAGGFRNDLLALGDPTPHDDRYVRTAAYTRIVLDLLRGDEPVTADGPYYTVDNLRLTPPLPPEHLPEVLMSGSSPAGRAAALAVGATPVTYPAPPGEEEPFDDGGHGHGVRVGIVARDTAEEAWRVALDRFPDDRAGRITHRLAMGVSDSHWHERLSARSEGGRPGGEVPALDGDRGDDGNDDDGPPSPYWLGPFKTYKTFCPYLVGDHATVASQISGYVAAGATTIVLDIPPSREELAEIEQVFALVEPRPVSAVTSGGADGGGTGDAGPSDGATADPGGDRRG